MEKNIVNKIEKYKNSIIKLQSINAQFIEIIGQLEDVFNDGFISLYKPVITADKSWFNFSSVMSSIIKLELSNEDVINNTLTVPMATLYKNDNTSNVAILNIKDYVFVPLYEPKIFKLDEEIINRNEDLMKQKEVCNVMRDYIEYIYREFRNNISINKISNKIKNEETDDN